MIRPFGKRREYFRIFGHPFTEDFIKKKRKEKSKSNGRRYSVYEIGTYQASLIPWVMNDVASMGIE